MHLFALIVALVPIAVQLFNTKREPASEPTQGAGELTVPETSEDTDEGDHSET